MSFKSWRDSSCGVLTLLQTLLRAARKSCHTPMSLLIEIVAMTPQIKHWHVPSPCRTLPGHAESLSAVGPGRAPHLPAAMTQITKM